MARTLSALPGTLVYMLPEALDDRHRYGPSIALALHFDTGKQRRYSMVIMSSAATGESHMAVCVP